MRLISPIVKAPQVEEEDWIFVWDRHYDDLAIVPLEHTEGFSKVEGDTFKVERLNGELLWAYDSKGSGKILYRDKLIHVDELTATSYKERAP